MHIKGNNIKGLKTSTSISFPFFFCLPTADSIFGIALDDDIKWNKWPMNVAN